VDGVGNHPQGIRRSREKRTDGNAWVRMKVQITEE
jgi:hypothetical protein